MRPVCPTTCRAGRCDPGHRVGRVTRRAEYSASTKKTLLDVAQELFTEQGYAGTSRGALVAGKQALFEAVCERVEHAASKAVHDRIKNEPDPWLKARAGLRAFLEAVRQ